MSNEEIIKQVENLLERKLTQEECRFLTVAGGRLGQDSKKPIPQTVKVTTKIA